MAADEDDLTGDGEDPTVEDLVLKAERAKAAWDALARERQAERAQAVRRRPVPDLEALVGNFLAEPPDQYLEMLRQGGPYPCRSGCGAMLELPGVCNGCADRQRVKELTEQRREALETIPVAWRDCSFSQPEALCGRCKDREAIAQAKHHLGRLVRGQEWLVVLAGESGEGKTSLACAMLRYVIEHGAGWTCFFAFAPDIAWAFRSSRRNEMPSIIEECEKAWMLCIDDLGADATYRDTLRAVIQRREMRRRPTIVTTFMTEQETQVYGGGIRRRLYRDGGVVWVGGMPAWMLEGSDENKPREA